MSLRRHLLNRWLRAVERPRIARAADPASLRRSMDMQARLFFHAPRATRTRWTRLGGRDTLELVPRGADTGCVVFYLHGGGFAFGSPRAYAALAGQLAWRSGARALLPSYRLAPENPFPAAPDDVYDAWQGLMAEGIDPARVVIGGDSAGGALALGLLGRLCAEGAPLPAGAFGLSPLTDVTYSGQSFVDNASRDAVLPAERAHEMARMFLAGQSAKAPSISPLYGDFEGAPPVWLTVGDTEILRDDAARFADRCRAQGVDVTLVEREDLPHVWPLFHNVLPEARETLDTLARWIRQRPDWPAGS